MGDSSIISSIEKDFFDGIHGDCKVKFVHDGQVVDTRKWHSYILSKVEYFSVQDKFSEGVAKEFSIDITSFYQRCKVDFKKFIDATFGCLFEKDFDDLDLDLGSRYAVSRFREYLGLDYKGSMGYANVPCFCTDEEHKEVAAAFVTMLMNCSDALAELVFTKDLRFTDDGILCIVMEALTKHGLCSFAKKVCSEMCDRYLSNCKRFDSDAADMFLDDVSYNIERSRQLGNGFCNDIVRCAELHIECGKEDNLKRYPCSSFVNSTHLECFRGFDDMEEDEELPAWPLLESMECTSETTAGRLRAMAFLLSDIFRPEVWSRFDSSQKAMLSHVMTELRYDEEEAEAEEERRDRIFRRARDIDEMMADKLNEIHTELFKRLQNASGDASLFSAGNKRLRVE